MRVALVRPLTRCPSYDPEVQEPLGIEYLGAVLRAAGHQVLLQDAMLSSPPEGDLARAILAFRPRVAGISLMSDSDISSANALIGRVTAAGPPGVVWVAGGSFVSTEPGRAASLLPAETRLIRHEGEGPLLRLLEALDDREPSTGAPSPDPGRELDGLPWPARDFAKQAAARCGTMNVQGSRGCSGRCAYCCMPGASRPSGRSWRGRSPENIASELQELNRAYGVAAFNFVDDDFLGPRRQAEERALGLADAIRERGLRIGFGAQLRPHTLTPTAARALAGAGLAYAFVGVENDDAATLRAWRRPAGADPAWRAIRRLRMHRVEVAAGTILFHPGATQDAVRRLARKLSDHKMLNFRTAVSRLHLLPGSYLHDQERREGRIPVDAAGPFTPPIRDPGARDLFDRLVRSLAPLRPCWVHAASMLPGLVSRHRAGLPVARKLSAVRAVTEEMDAWVREVLLGLVDETAADARSGSRRLALSACGRLREAGLVSDPGQLRLATDLEGGT